MYCNSIILFLLGLCILLYAYYIISYILTFINTNVFIRREDVENYLLNLQKKTYYSISQFIPEFVYIKNKKIIDDSITNYLKKRRLDFKNDFSNYNNVNTMYQGVYVDHKTELLCMANNICSILNKYYFDSRINTRYSCDYILEKYNSYNVANRYLYDYCIFDQYQLSLYYTNYGHNIYKLVGNNANNEYAYIRDNLNISNQYYLLPNIYDPKNIVIDGKHIKQEIKSNIIDGGIDKSFIKIISKDIRKINLRLYANIFITLD